jgi:hypothetical protein
MGFPSQDISFRRVVGRDALFIASLPSIRAVVTDADLDARLLDVVIARLRAAISGGDRDLTTILCGTLGAWGSRAAPAVPDLRYVLRGATPGQYPSPAAAIALGRIGPAASGAAPQLRRHVRAGSHDAAWALGRVTGDIQEAVTALTGMIRLPAANHVLRYLGDFGAEAFAAQEWIAECLSTRREDWVRAEAAYALWRITGDATTTAHVLEGVARPLAEGDFLPVRLAAMKYLAAIPDPAPDGPTKALATATARAILANPRRLANSGGWRAFTEDDQVRAAATSYLRRTLSGDGEPAA